MSVAHHADMVLDLYDEVLAEFPEATAEELERITLERWEDIQI